MTSGIEQTEETDSALTRIAEEQIPSDIRDRLVAYRIAVDEAIDTRRKSGSPPGEEELAQIRSSLLNEYGLTGILKRPENGESTDTSDPPAP